MYCPHCENVFSPKKVIQTWHVEDGTVKRKRKCGKCGKQFHTVERTVILKEIAKTRLK